MSDSPTSRTIRAYREIGYLCEVVERWNQHTQTRHDLFGFIDLIAIGEGQTIGIQATSTPHLTSRWRKILDERSVEARAWLEAGNKIEVWGWKKYAQPRDGRWWRPSVRTVTLKELQEFSVEIRNDR